MQQNEQFSFVEAEEKCIEFWEKEKIFAKSLQKTKGKKPYIFYDGPPFATGLPHHGHLLASTLKDIIPRYFTMRGFYVERRFGWDCHGLPVEQEIDKKLGMSAHDAVEKWGIKAYNDECRGIIQRYTKEWRKPFSVWDAGWILTTITRPWTGNSWSLSGGWSSSFGSKD